MRLWIALGVFSIMLNAQESDVNKLQGSWTIVSLEMEGKSIPVSGAKIVIEGSRFTTTGMGAPYKGTMEINTSVTPKTIDMKFDEGPEKGNSSLGIYELDGDTWRLCLTTRGNERPKKFAAEPGTGIALEILKKSPSE
jgi:uncharacterized protein (TIGR03067 family)